MKNKFYWILIWCFFIPNLSAQAQSFSFGVNLAGGSFADESTMPGVYGEQYTYPTIEELDYYHSKNLDLIRMPFRWERVQNVLGGPLDPVEIALLRNIIQEAANRNMQVLLDLHNSARYRLGDNESIIGEGVATIEHVQDLWTKLAAEFINEDNIWGYGIMNEPHDMLYDDHWFDIAQAIMDGIRSVDASTTIVVGGDSWSSADRWLEESDNLKDLIDPNDNIIFEAHIYFDNDASGQYLGSYAEEQGSPSIGIDRAAPFVWWLQEHNFRGFIGEYGIPDNDEAWLVTLDNLLVYLEQNCINGTYWAGGPWWGDNFMAIDPVGSDGESDPLGGAERPQMAVVGAHTQAMTGCSYLTAIESIEPTSLNHTIYPNPAQGVVVVVVDNVEFNLELIQVDGQVVVTANNIMGSRTLDISSLTSGLYILKISVDDLTSSVSKLIILGKD